MKKVFAALTAVTLLLALCAPAYAAPAEVVIQVEVEDPSAPAGSATVEQAFVAATANVNIRTEPSVKGKKLGVLKRGTRALYLSDTGGWTQIQTMEGVTGYVSSKYVSWNTAPAAGPQAKPDKEANNSTDAARTVLDAVNAERQAAGLSPLTLNDTLNALCALKAGDMAVNDYFEHDSPTYGSADDMMRQEGFSGSTGENIAWGKASVDTVAKGWLASPSHRENCLRAEFTQMGFAKCTVDGRTAWAQMFVSD